ncbi:putative isochorismatase hydrolase [Diplodia seriata]|uniref:Putative isochorismatase hydrolase n=1 Tax=Diplodia seriata TaxID=420778 RepID=A0A0G2GEG6_9PEZI|nr:putative isochorismatase hydrolase [Diplodia seriata]
MSPQNLPPPNTALLLVDPYNDFLHPDGKLYPRVAESLVATDTVAHLKEVVKAARDAHLPSFYALHQTWKAENYRGWLHMNSSTTAIKQMKAFEEGTDKVKTVNEWTAALEEAHGLEKP